MPPFITHQGRTGYFLNGQFIPATQEEYNNQMSLYNQFGNNPFMAAQKTFTQQQAIPQGVIQAPMTNEQKVQSNQGITTPGAYNPQDVINYDMTDKGLGFTVRDMFFPSTAQTTSGMPLVGNPSLGQTMNAYEIANDLKYKYGNPYVDIKSSLFNKSAIDNTVNIQSDMTVPAQMGSSLSSAATNALNANQNNTPIPTIDQGTGDVLGSWGKVGFDAKKAFTGTAGTAALGAGIGVVTNLIGANASKYDPRVGMSKPNALGTMLGDSTFTQIGSNFGPAGMAIGGTVDLIKNAIKYQKQKDRYENKKLAVDTMQQLDDARENMKPDYTGYARNGIQVNPYLKAQNGTKVIVDGKEMSVDSNEYRKLYNTGNLMNVDEEGMPARLTEEVVVTEQMPEEIRKQRERDKQELNYNWSAGSQNPYISQPQNTILSGINYTMPSVVTMPDYQPIYNPEDDLLNMYRGKSFGIMPFPYKNADGLAMGYNDFGNNAWMSSGLGSVDDGTSVLGHLAVRYGDDYNENLKNNDIPTLYLFEKDLNKEKLFVNDVMGAADKYYDARKELMNLSDNLEREGRFINNVLLPQGYTYNIVADDPGNKLIRSLTPDRDKFMGSVTLTPEMYKAISSAPNQEEAKRRLIKMAKLPDDVNMNNIFIHMNLSRPKYLSAYLKAKSVNPESVKGWHQERPGNKYDKNGNLIKPSVKTYKQGGQTNPYIK